MAKWGIIGCGAIAARMAAVLGNLADAELAAVAARDTERAEAFARTYHAGRAYGCYEALAEDESVEIVYVATINTTHEKAIRLCLEAGKAVLCEKPFAMSAEQAAPLFALARSKGCLLVEGMWSAFLPAWCEIRRRISLGEIGKVRSMQADFSVYIPFDPQSRIYCLEKGAGALLDIGIYAVHALLNVVNWEPEKIKASGRMSPTGSDSYAVISLQYTDGTVAIATCGCDCDGAKDARIYGENGWISIPNMAMANQFTVYKAGEEPQLYCFDDQQDGFRYEVEEMQRLLADGAVTSAVMPPERTLAALKILDEAALQLRQ